MNDFTLDYLFEEWRYVLELAWDHLTLSITAIVLGLIFAIPLGLLAARFQQLTLPILGILGAIYTIPSLAFLAFLIPTPLGLGRDNALVVLAAYSQIFLVRNIVAGLRGVEPAIIEAARGMGMTSAQVYRQVMWPLALPVILAGVRTALVATISMATIAGWVGAGGLGRLLFDGIKLRRTPMILAGAIAITVLALAVDFLLRRVEGMTAARRSRQAAAA